MQPSELKRLREEKRLRKLQELEEFKMLLEKLIRTKPDIHRHIVGMIRTILR
jgi:hypothetical protein